MQTEQKRCPLSYLDLYALLGGLGSRIDLQRSLQGIGNSITTTATTAAATTHSIHPPHQKSTLQRFLCQPICPIERESDYRLEYGACILDIAL